MKAGLRRLVHIERAIRPPAGCDQCSWWGTGQLIIDDLGHEIPPAICPSCGRDRPPSRVVMRIAGVDIERSV